MKQIGKSLFGCIFLQHFLLVYDTVAVTTLLIITTFAEFSLLFRGKLVTKEPMV